jgi:hypothetical protein
MTKSLSFGANVKLNDNINDIKGGVLAAYRLPRFKMGKTHGG